MATIDEIAQEKQRLSERLARLDADRVKLAEQLNELEIAERVLTRFGQSGAGERRRRGRPARAQPASAPERRGRAARTVGGLSLSDAVLQAVTAHPAGMTAGEVSAYLSRELGMAARPNHLGIALQRHRRAGRLENRNERWYLPNVQRHGEAAQTAASG